MSSSGYSYRRSRSAYCLVFPRDCSRYHHQPIIDSSAWKPSCNNLSSSISSRSRMASHAGNIRLQASRFIRFCCYGAGISIGKGPTLYRHLVPAKAKRYRDDRRQTATRFAVLLLQVHTHSGCVLPWHMSISGLGALSRTNAGV
jgi:hypothetical protein